MRVFSEVGVKAVIATNTLPKPSPEDAHVQAGVGGGELFDDAMAAVGHLCSAKKRGNYKVDVMLAAASSMAPVYVTTSASVSKQGNIGRPLVYRGPFAAAIIESELAEYDYEYEAVQRESLA